MIWRRLYGHQSNRDGGTLLQLRNLVNRSSVPKDPKSDVNATKDFIYLALVGHVVVAAMEVLGMKSIEDQPTSEGFPSSETRLTKDEKKQVLSRITSTITSKFVNLSVILQSTANSKESTGAKSGRKKKRKTKRKTKGNASKQDETNSSCDVDGVLEYAREFLTLGLLHSEFDDAISEGDGERVLRCWKFFLLFFKVSGRKNYSIEALNFLAQYHLLLPPRLANQLLWSRFVNVHGKAGHNIASDLHMEHLNRSCKFAIAGLGANATPHAITRIGRCIGPLMRVCAQYDNVFEMHGLTGKHSMPGVSNDLKKVVKELMTSGVFRYEKGRYHSCFKSIRGSWLSQLNKEELLEWMNSKLNNLWL